MDNLKGVKVHINGHKIQFPDNELSQRVCCVWLKTSILVMEITRNGRFHIKKNHCFDRKLLY